MTRPPALVPRLVDPRDPRVHQTAALAALALWGALGLGIDLAPARVAAIAVAALATQWLASWRVGLPVWDPRSALISALSLCLLLRTSSLALAVLAAVLAVGSKFVVRWRGKHVFNPTNLALVALVLASDAAWISSGQWGSASWFAVAVAGAGVIVVRRARRDDVTWAFLAAWAGLLLARAAWLGDPLAIPLHQLRNGAVLVFAFFMISDPKTTPDTRLGRVAFAALVALVGYGIQFVLWEPHGPVLALAFCAPVVPWIDRLLPGERYVWGAPSTPGPGPASARLPLPAVPAEP